MTDEKVSLFDLQKCNKKNLSLISKKLINKNICILHWMNTMHQAPNVKYRELNIENEQWHFPNQLTNSQFK